MKISVRRLALTSVALIWAAVGVIAVAEDKAPAKLTFTAKNGNVTFDHVAHAKREKEDCKTCHDKLFEQSAKAALNFKQGMHRPAELAKASCGSCHRAGGAAFETKGNCVKCHVKG